MTLVFLILFSEHKSKLNAKRFEVNQTLTKLCDERNIYLIEHLKKMKPNHLIKLNFT